MISVPGGVLQANLCMLLKWPVLYPENGVTPYYGTADNKVSYSLKSETKAGKLMDKIINKLKLGLKCNIQECSWTDVNCSEKEQKTKRNREALQYNIYIYIWENLVKKN